MNDNHSNIETVDNTTNLPKANRYLLSDAIFEKLRLAQRKINFKTDITPSIRKIISEIIGDEQIENATQKLIEQYS